MANKIFHRQSFGVIFFSSSFSLKKRVCLFDKMKFWFTSLSIIALCVTGIDSIYQEVCKGKSATFSLKGAGKLVKGPRGKLYKQGGTTPACMTWTRPPILVFSKNQCSEMTFWIVTHGAGEYYLRGKVEGGNRVWQVAASKTTGMPSFAEVKIIGGSGTSINAPNGYALYPLQPENGKNICDS